ncbi:tRNA (adenosine(37)-N6)-threonylcarbamoyltransferase complex ATPase subunit type 1 TsaE [Candidatus Lucifugimonas marina]|jgi:tRNA threonylcarbamoyl adenosine modification protein YjeE|uniref:tRNA threonylcarbamoyladenosine biosynthesis protein TsaE n=1 Tax=Candidatus Lucifugimonas marina TaxID=3038979 RepID=A0AAJ5ZDN0_9CHLR|nr:tRNA (adenosine(37)-N6)-threonylcarbamoyltransferase complex ATPase subunit type 1 TsaE [SAR202 cluster bacterium JH702]MDG0868932.1 tRNA (adenosine(37)-N6)-threonylcarbamoyltransferase complex ATPase subunit type 1 TsaE [SAR202 cluster bacterium JH639]WFG35560.1 tRNA (adenosine(37)-N6)-threonylcarbamoyltransferase complex ATPase subunit type 1 TsaE [SAR202 cluster bacterium JH545]WFG39507.1 tRNA (adenosine(37)-N6)-threonylcarbamoyltransferase complex ATPase subunit type 1 TsaE [SAR202 cluste
MAGNVHMSGPSPALLLVSDSESETVRIGKSIGIALRAGDTVLLSGDLGAGKTRLVHGMADGIESPIPARSPTFVIVNEYPGRVHLSHCDLYRLGSIDEVEELALEERLPTGALVIEWPEVGGNVLPEDVLFLKLENGDHDDQRSIMFTPTGPRSAGLLSRSAAIYESLDAAVGLSYSAAGENTDSSGNKTN